MEDWGEEGLLEPVIERLAALETLPVGLDHQEPEEDGREEGVHRGGRGRGIRRLDVASPWLVGD